MHEQTVNIGIDKFHEYLVGHQNEVSQNRFDGYYPVNVVAEAYTQGFSDGQQKGQSEFVKILRKQTLDLFKKKSQQVYILTTKVKDTLKKEGFIVDSFYIDIFATCPRVIVSVQDDLLLNEAFIQVAYKEIFSVQEIYSKVFDNDVLDMSLVGSDDLDKSCLEAEGFGYSEDFTKHEPQN